MSDHNIIVIPHGFGLSKDLMPCCNTSRTLHEIVHHGPQDFGRLALVAMTNNLHLRASSATLART